MRTVVLALVPIFALIGCARHPRDLSQLSRAGLAESFYLDTVRAAPIPPMGWIRDPVKKSDKHTHEVWISPTGSTAYGIVHFSLPLPVGPDLALWGFMREMHRKQGEATLLSEQDDPDLPGIRFVAEGGPYKIRVNLITDGWEGWAIYAGTLRNRPIEQNELDLARRAREYTATGKAARTGAGGAAAGYPKNPAQNERRRAIVRST